MKLFEQLTEQTARTVARHTSRRGFLGTLGTLLAGGASIPLLPVARAAAEAQADPDATYPGVSPQASITPEETGDPSRCDYWRYCGIGGPLCACCGGSANACPPGAEMSPLGWIGTCRNPVDNKNYIISYNDCCGKPKCTRCLCAPHNAADKPVVRPQSSSNYRWCLGTKSNSFTCATAVVLGVALDQE